MSSVKISRTKRALSKSAEITQCSMHCKENCVINVTDNPRFLGLYGAGPLDGSVHRWLLFLTWLGLAYTTLITYLLYNLLLA